MRGTSARQATMLTAVTPEALVPQRHPIRQIKPIVDAVLNRMSPTFERMYARDGRPSIPPEHLLKGCLLMAFFSVRSERQFCERLGYDMLFKWFLDLNVMDPTFDHSVFSKNKDRLLEHDAAREFFGAIVAEARRRKLLSEEHFTVDGTLLEAWASMKSFRPKDGGTPPPVEGGRNPNVDFRGTAERDTALDMLQGVPGSRHITVGADKGYDTADFIWECRDMDITPHVAQKRYSAIDRRTTRHEGYRLSQRVRKRVEEVFGWVKTVGGGRKLRYRGVERNQLWAEMTLAGYNLVRLAKLAPTPA